MLKHLDVFLMILVSTLITPAFVLESSHDPLLENGGVDMLIFNANNAVNQVLGYDYNSPRKTLVAFHSDSKNYAVKTIIYRVEANSEFIYHGYRLREQGLYVRELHKFAFSDSLEDILRTFNCSANFLDDEQNHQESFLKAESNNSKVEYRHFKDKAKLRRTISKSKSFLAGKSPSRLPQEVNTLKKSSASLSPKSNYRSPSSSYPSKENSKVQSSVLTNLSESIKALNAPESIPQHLQSDFISSTFHTTPVVMPKKLLTYTASPMNDPEFQSRKPASGSAVITEAEARWK